jgi:hypothetical protein
LINELRALIKITFCLTQWGTGSKPLWARGYRIEALAKQRVVLIVAFSSPPTSINRINKT